MRGGALVWLAWGCLAACATVPAASVAAVADGDEAHRHDGEPLLVGVVPDIPGDAPGGDAVAIAARGAVDLAGYALTDGEDTWPFPARELPAGTVLWVVGNLSAWRAHQGPEPATVMAPALRLGDEGDDITLLDGEGAAVDAVAYGDKDATGILDASRRALVMRRDRTAAGWTDTDHPSDWSTPRLHRLGETALDQPTFEADALTVYSSPDASFSVLQDLMAGATRRLHLHVYELRSAALVDGLVGARLRHPGLDLQVLVDGNPVGQTAAERHATADALRRVGLAGGQGWLAGNGRYDDHHLKVLVADDAVAVQSENWVDSGVPADPSWGNRGWGVVLRDREAADWFASWMALDRAAWDTAPFDLDAYDPTFEAPPRRHPRAGEYAPIVPARAIAGPVRVTPLVSPDHTGDPRADPVAGLLGDAQQSILAQQLDLALHAGNALGWSSADPWTEALAAAARRGVQVAVQAAAPFAADDDGNALAMARLEEAGARTGQMDRPGIPTLHNKAFVIDGAIVVLGSTNGNHHSRSANREVALAIASPEAAAHFLALAKSDADPPAAPRDWSVPGQDLRALPGTPWPTLLAITSVALAARLRR